MLEQTLDLIVTTVTPMLPMWAAALTAVAIAYTRAQVNRLVPSWAFPILIPLAGGLVSVGAQAVGYDLGDFNPQTAGLTMWQTAIAGTVTGGFSITLHQAVTQIRTRFAKAPPA